MLFSGLPFLYYFLPVVLLVYYAAPRRAKNGILLLFSLIFYAWGEPRYIVLMLVSILCAYGFGLWIEKKRGKKAAGVLTVLSAAISLSFLLFFKYTDFFLANVNALTGAGLPMLNLPLPVGISFYTFQILSYTVDVWRGRTAAQRSFIDFGAYVSLFAQLVAGPIIRYADMAQQLTDRVHSWEKAAYGIRRFVLGLGKKVLIANVLGEFVKAFRASGEVSVLFYWLYALALVLQVYFDFSGYSDMALGLGNLFGFTFPENFNYPLISGSVKEFWRRWHISLGLWFRDYVYIPLGGSRVTFAKYIRNVFVVWFLTGMWHGAQWNYIFWGLGFGLLLVLEKKIRIRPWPRPAEHLYMFFVICFSFVIFAGEDMAQVLADLRALLGLGDLPLLTAETVYYFRSYRIVFLTALAGATPLPALLYRRLDAQTGGGLLCWLEPIGLLGILLLATAYLVDGSYNPFLYFRF